MQSKSNQGCELEKSIPLECTIMVRHHNSSTMAWTVPQMGLFMQGEENHAKKMMRENRECVTINPVVSLSGVICVGQVIFGTKGITNQMAPKEPVEKIDNLLIPTTDNGCQDHTSLLACYKLFDKYLNRAGTERPVVLTSDGHSSRFDFEILKFCNKKKSIFLSRHLTQQV